MSEWKSAGELHDIAEQIEQKERLFDLYGLSLFCDRAFLSEDFRPDAKWVECIKLSLYGVKYLTQFHQSGQKHEQEHEIFALFQLFYHHDLFIDFASTDIEAIFDLLNEMHRTGQAKWPYVFGNQLYHKFNDSETAAKTDHLDAPDAEALLLGTPQGVFQTGNVVSGPLGFVRGLEERILPSTLKFPLWHCSDPGCQARHLVTLRAYKSSFQRSKDALNRFIFDSFGPPSEWSKPILYIHRVGKWPNGRPYYDLPALIGDCLIGEERRQLLLRCIQSKHNSFLMQCLERAGKSQNSPTEITRNLTTEEQHQLLLLIPDHDLVDHLDELIAKREIRIPPAESRKVKTYTHGPSRDTISVTSQ